MEGRTVDVELAELPDRPVREEKFGQRRGANVVFVVRFAVGAGRADGYPVAAAVHAKAVAPGVVFARSAIEEVLLFELAERGAAFAVLRAEALRGDLNLVCVTA